MKKIFRKIVAFTIMLSVVVASFVYVKPKEVYAGISDLKDIYDAIVFTKDFYDDVEDFRGVSKSNAQFNHIRNVRAVGLYYYSSIRANGDLKKTIKYFADNNYLYPVNLGLSSKSSNETKEERVTVYIINCLSDYYNIAEYYGDTAKDWQNPQIFSKFGLGNMTAGWTSLTTYGTSLVNRTHRNFFGKTVYDYQKNIYRALVGAPELGDWRYLSTVMRNITSYNASKMVNTAVDYLYN